MQKKRIKLIVSIFIISMFSLLAGCDYLQAVNDTEKNNIDNSKNISDESGNTAQLSFVVMGDVHDNTDNFEKAVDDFYKINPKINALILNGDIVDQGTDEQYESMKKIIDKNAGKLPEIIIKNIGNHEFYNYSTDSNSQEDIDNFTKKHLEFSGSEKVYHDTWINGYHFISLGSDNLTSEDLNTTQASLSQEQILWFREKINENYSQGKPIFVFIHQPIFADFFGRQLYGIKQGDEIKRILENYPEAIVFSSHTHKEFGDASIQENIPYTMVYTGAIGYTLVKDDSSDNGRKRDNSENNSIYIEVNDDIVTIKERDIENHQWVNSTELININY